MIYNHPVSKDETQNIPACTFTSPQTPSPGSTMQTIGWQTVAMATTDTDPVKDSYLSLNVILNLSSHPS